MADKYRRKCRTCDEFILMLKCDDGHWRAFDFPEEGINDWTLHNKGGSC